MSALLSDLHRDARFISDRDASPLQAYAFHRPLANEQTCLDAHETKAKAVAVLWLPWAAPKYPKIFAASLRAINHFVGRSAFSSV